MDFQRVSHRRKYRTSFRSHLGSEEFRSITRFHLWVAIVLQLLYCCNNEACRYTTTRVSLTRVSTSSSSTAFCSPTVSLQVKAASRSRKTLVFIVTSWKGAAIQWLPWKLRPHTRWRVTVRGRGGERRAAQPAPSTSNADVLWYCSDKD